MLKGTLSTSMLTLATSTVRHLMLWAEFTVVWFVVLKTTRRSSRQSFEEDRPPSVSTA